MTGKRRKSAVRRDPSAAGDARHHLWYGGRPLLAGAEALFPGWSPGASRISHFRLTFSCADPYNEYPLWPVRVSSPDIPDGESRRMPADQGRSESRRGLTRRILLVEDDPQLRETLEDILRYEGYDVLLAENGQSALPHLQGENSPDIILLDLMMPIMNGWDFRVQQLRNPLFARIPVVLISAAGGIQEHASMLRADAFLEKPIDVEALLGLVRRICG